MHRQAVIAAIDDGVARLGQALPRGGAERLAFLLTELARWNRRLNLTAIRDIAAMVPGHVLDSLAARPFVAGPRLADIGTGAGFPGLPLAIAEPALEVELVDSSGKKIAFVRHIIAGLDLRNARATQVRVENYAPVARFDTVIARALGSLPQLLDIAGHLVGDRGVMLALKGQYPHDELEQLSHMTTPGAGWHHQVTGVEVPGLEARSRHLVRLWRQQANGA